MTDARELLIAELAVALLILPSARAGESAFQRIQNMIFTPHCASCHSGFFAPHRLRLDTHNSYRSLVGVRSAEVPSLERVKSGDADASYLVQKVEGQAAIGMRMPAGKPPLSSEDIDLIRRWIAEGAVAPDQAVSRPLVQSEVRP